MPCSKGSISSMYCLPFILNIIQLCAEVKSVCTYKMSFQGL